MTVPFIMALESDFQQFEVINMRKMIALVWLHCVQSKADSILAVLLLGLLYHPGEVDTNRQ